MQRHTLVLAIVRRLLIGILTIGLAACGDVLGPADGGPDLADELYPPENPNDPAYIYLARADGSEITRLTRGSWPAWSPDGQAIAYHTESMLYVISVDGSRLVELAAGRYPAWSPDGARLLVTNAAGLNLMNADGSGITTLLHHDFIYPSNAPWNRGIGTSDWSPDGDRIVFEHLGDYDFAHPRIYVVNADGSDLRILTREPDGFDPAESYPSWSPDGARIVFWSVRYGLALVDSAGGAPSPIAGNQHLPSSLTRPRLSPDGTTVLFGASGIWTVPAIGGDVQALVPFGYWPTWSPDGTRIAFVSRIPCESLLDVRCT